MTLRRFTADLTGFTMLIDVQIIRTPIEDLVIFQPTPFETNGATSPALSTFRFSRGRHRPSQFQARNQSRSYHGARRGLHGRSGTGEAKLVCCANGAVLDVVVDA